MEQSLSVIVPAYNEELSVESALAEIFAAAPSLPGAFEVIVVNDGSTDRTREIVESVSRRRPEIRLINHKKNLGFGGAFMSGVQDARMHYCVLVPGDHCISRGELTKIFKRVGMSDLLICHYMNIHAGSKARHLVSKTFVRLLNMICGLDLRYYNGTNVYPTQPLKRLRVTEGFAFSAQLVTALLQQGLSYSEIPLVTASRIGGSSRAFTPKNIVSVAMALVRIGLERNRFRR